MRLCSQLASLLCAGHGGPAQQALPHAMQPAQRDGAPPKVLSRFRVSPFSTAWPRQVTSSVAESSTSAQAGQSVPACRLACQQRCRRLRFGTSSAHRTARNARQRTHCGPCCASLTVYNLGHGLGHCKRHLHRLRPVGRAGSGRGPAPSGCVAEQRGAAPGSTGQASSLRHSQWLSHCSV